MLGALAASARLWEAELQKRLTHSEGRSRSIATRRLVTPPRSRVGITRLTGCRQGSQFRNDSDVNAFTYAARWPGQNSGVLNK
jgi:hypothetical protein